MALCVLEQAALWEAEGILVQGWKTLICPSIKLDQWINLTGDWWCYLSLTPFCPCSWRINLCLLTSDILKSSESGQHELHQWGVSPKLSEQRCCQSSAQCQHQTGLASGRTWHFTPEVLFSGCCCCCCWITQVGRDIFFLKYIRLYLSCYKGHCVNLGQPKFTVNIFPSVVIHKVDFPLPHQTLNYWFMHNVNYAFPICSIAWLYLCHWILLFPSQACWAIHRHWDDLDDTNSALEWFERHKFSGAVDWVCRCCLLAPDHGHGCVLYMFCADCFCVSFSARLRHSKELVFVKLEDGFLLKWYEMTRQNAFVGEKITWEYWTSSCSCTFMRLLNYFKII